MSEPINPYRKVILVEKKTYSNGVISEQWHTGIDNEYHIHLPDGMLITFEYEDQEGSVRINE